MAKLQPIDFASMLRELDELGLSPVAVADALGISRSTPYRWLDGSEPLHSHGAAFLIFYTETIRHSETLGAQSPARTDSKTQGDDDAPDSRSDPSKRFCAAG